jgi:hypothetical protein
VLYRDWRPLPEEIGVEEPPVVAIPDGPYLAQASPEAVAAFEQQAARLEAAGCRVRRVGALEDIEAITEACVEV